ncbi:hypothetical protein [Xanthomonas arboricola]|uniref:hypothetical protein n=1 Tax=Xanthomonas arboricola TaxID=56448 RepID=UPI001E573AF1|nr:hypothetical protein [Xanthomonas arboricola]
MTTACTDSPSKLKVALPLLAMPSVGAGALAALWLIMVPLPRRITGVGLALALPSARCSALV